MTDDEVIVVEIIGRFKAHFTTFTDDDLRARSGLGMRQPEQYETQKETMDSWQPFRTGTYGGQPKGYANIPLLITAELLRRANETPTVSAVIERTIKEGFTTPRGAKGDYAFLRPYLNSAEARGFCRLR
jgi:hypothetical protein